MARTSSTIIMARMELYDYICRLYEANTHVPIALAELIQGKLAANVANTLIRDSFVLRSESEYDYGVASWELNLLCNYNCPHCYLGTRPNSSISIDDRIKVIDRVAELGVVRLQITGGEPLIDPIFQDTYREIYDRGIITTISTNGAWLSREKIRNLLQERPPMRITVSMYGATEGSYEAMTRTPKGSFGRFLRGLEAVNDMGVSLRINIIASTFNQDEMNAMRNLAATYTADYHVYDQMSATISGNNSPLLFQVDDLWRKQSISDKQPFTGCEAGVKSFHIDPYGNAMMCKVGRSSKISLVHEGIESMAELASLSKLQFARLGSCKNCVSQSMCTTCPLVVEQYRSAKASPRIYCRVV